MSEANKTVVRRYFEDLLNGMNPEAVDELIADNCVLTAPVLPGELKGIDVFRLMQAGLAATFPDLRFTLHDGVAEGKQVVWFWTMEGTHSGEWLGVPTTGKRLSITGCDLFEITDGKITRVHIQADYLGAMRQMGAIASTSAHGVE